jgi:4-amino-4-deoxy-L-arabinose transferase-like glycosyltransferase
VAVVFGVAGAVLAAHLLTNVFTPYGIHRDEFLYMAMGRHLRLFRMDFPPFIAIVSQASRAFSDSLVVLRLTPALAGAALVVMAALFARELGGGRYAQLLAALAVATSPLYLRAGNLFQPVVFDQLWWTLALFALARLGRDGFRGDARWWLVLGVAGGVGLLTKFSILFLGLGVLIALLLGPQRRMLLTPWPWLTLAITLVLGSPSIVGQIQLGFPVVGQMRELQGTQLERVTYLAFLSGQLFMLGPALVLAALGLAALLARSMESDSIDRTGPGFRTSMESDAIDRIRPGFRVVGWAALASLLVIMLLHGKPYYAGPVYPALLGAGAAAIGAWAERLRTRRRRTSAAVVRGVAVGLVVAYGAVTLPLGLPIVPPAPMARYAAALGVTAAVETNWGAVLPLPQDYADMLGWEAQVAAVARVYHALPAAEREQAVIVADNYGEAGAVDYYGPRYGLPSAVAPTGSYWFFGPGKKPGAVIIKVGGERSDIAPFCGSLALAGRVNAAWVVPEEQHLSIWVCRQPHHTLQDVWPMLAGEN